VFGAPLCAEPPAPQRPPAKGAAPRVDSVRAGARAARLRHRLLGGVDADGFPVVVPVGEVRAQPGGMVLSVPVGLVPAGGRRAGLIAHWFSPGVLGQRQHGPTSPRKKRRNSSPSLREQS
jgi:hypothetical protein